MLFFCFLGTPEELLLKKNGRKPPTVRLPLGKKPNYKTRHSVALKKAHTVKKKVSRDNEVDQSVDTNPADSLLMEKQPEEQIVEIDELEPPNQHFSADDAYHIQLPSSYWYVRKTTADSCNFFEVVVKDVTAVIEKNVNIDFKNHKVSVTFQSRKVPNFEGSCIPSTSKGMEALLLSIHESKMCPGIMHNPTKHPHHTEVVRNGNLISNIWRNNRYVNKFQPYLNHYLHHLKKNAVLINFISCRIMMATNEESKKACPGCKLLDISLRKQFKRQKTVNTLLNHRYMSLKQLAKKVSLQKGKMNCSLKKDSRKNNIQIKVV